MAQYRSALGKPVDMAQLASKNENVRAVGNMSVNARGDTIDGTGKVVVPVTKKVGEAYQRTVANRAANMVRQRNGSGPVEAKEKIETVESVLTSAPIVEEELLPNELDLEDDDEAAEIEALKAQETFEIKPASEAPDFVVPDVTTPKKK